MPFTHAGLSPEQLAKEDLVIGYVLRHPADGVYGQWMYLGCTPAEVGKTLADELDGDEGLSCVEREALLIEPRIFSRDEIDNMPEFMGW